ncbi:MAG: condensation domain-containing protein [Gammaproteobacteria bacterium]
MSHLANIQQDALEGFRLSPQQQCVWLAQCADGERAYFARCEFAIEGELDARRLERALQRVVERHEILRMEFRSIFGMTSALQIVCE